MENIKLQHLNKNAFELFSNASKAFSSSSSDKLKDRAKHVPSSFVDEGKKSELFLWVSTVLANLQFYPF